MWIAPQHSSLVADRTGVVCQQRCASCFTIPDSLLRYATRAIDEPARSHQWVIGKLSEMADTFVEVAGLFGEMADPSADVA